jgi:hypothetical protein
MLWSLSNLAQDSTILGVVGNEAPIADLNPLICNTFPYHVPVLIHSLYMGETRMPQLTSVIVYDVNDETAADAALDAICGAVETIMLDGSVSQATLTADDGTITNLLADEEVTSTTADQPASSETQEISVKEDTVAEDPNMDPEQSLPTGREF